MKILIDMNLSPAWVQYLAEHDVDAVHWSTLGDARADDTVLMDYAREHQMIVFTHDLDFGSILAATQARGPSVIQARTEDPVQASIGPLVLRALTEHAEHLRRGALVTLEPEHLRARILPIIPGIR